MEVTVTKENPILLKADVKVPWEQVAKPFEAATREIAKHAHIPGFRQGKAPMGFIKKRFHDQITQELTRTILPDTLEKAIEENEIRAVGQPRLSHVHWKENDHFHYEVYLEVVPDVELGEWRGLEIESRNVSITDDMVDQALQERLQRATTREPVADRGSQLGDVLEGQLTVLDRENHEVLDDRENFTMRLEQEGEFGYLAKELVDANPGDTIQLDFEPGDAPEMPEAWRSKQIQIMVDIERLIEVNQPELNDEFAKSQEAENLEDLKDKVAAELRDRSEEHENNAAKNRAVHQLLGKHPFDAPPSMIAHEAKSIMDQQFGPYLSQGNLDPKLMDSLMQAVYPQAKEKIRADLLLEAIAKDIGAEPTEEEVDKELEAVVEIFEVDSVAALRDDEKYSGVLDHMKLQLSRQKAMDAIMEAATIVKVDKLAEEIEAEKRAAEAGQAQAKKAAGGETGEEE